MVLIGYSGHSFVVIGILQAMGKAVTGYCDVEEKQFNPFSIVYHGKELEEPGINYLRREEFFIAVGDNSLRQKIYTKVGALGPFPINAIHPSSVIDPTVVLGKHGLMISAKAVINPLAKIENGVICNTGCIIEHECRVEEFAHVGPGAILCGNVQVGKCSYVGAGAVVRQGIRIGKNAMIGMGAVVVKDVADGETVAGNPSRLLIK